VSTYKLVKFQSYKLVKFQSYKLVKFQSYKLVDVFPIMQAIVHNNNNNNDNMSSQLKHIQPNCPHITQRKSSKILYSWLCSRDDHLSNV